MRQLRQFDYHDFPRLQCDDEEDVLVAVLYAYFDESGKLADTKSVAFCGVVGYESEWTSLGRFWNQTIKDAGLAYVKMADAMNWNGPFHLWNKGNQAREDLRDALLIKLTQKTCAMIQGFVSVPCTTDDFKALSEPAQKKYRDPVYLAFESSMRLLSEIARPGTVIHLCCDSSEEYSVQCLRLYHRLRMQNPDCRSLFRALTFAEEAHFPGLQVVDVYAYCQREIHTAGVSGARRIVNELRSILHRHEKGGIDLQTEWLGGANLGHGTSKVIPRVRQ